MTYRTNEMDEAKLAGATAPRTIEAVRRSRSRRRSAALSTPNYGRYGYSFGRI